jgi:isoleucyl-tRNA synthetase
MEGWGVASQGGVTVALELEVTPELRLEGLARELVRLLQDGRKAAGLAVSDRIVAGVIADGELAAALDAHRDEIAAEVLAVRLVSGPVENATYRQVSDLDSAPVMIELAKQ